MDEQSGFRQCRSTEDQLTYIAQTGWIWRKPLTEYGKKVY